MLPSVREGAKRFIGSDETSSKHPLQSPTRLARWKDQQKVFSGLSNHCHTDLSIHTPRLLSENDSLDHAIARHSMHNSKVIVSG